MSVDGIPNPLDLLHRRFAENCAQSLSQELEVVVHATPLAPAEVPYREHLLSLASPTFLLVLSSPRLHAELTIEIQLALAYLILEHRLGGSEPEPFIPRRRFTELESRLLAPNFEQFCRDLSAAWPECGQCLGEMAFTLAALESDPRARRLVPECEMVSVLSTELAVSSRNNCSLAGQSLPLRLTLCLTAPARAVLGTTSSTEDLIPVDTNRDRLIRFRAILSEAVLCAAELESIEPGDILTTEQALGAEISLFAASERLELRGRLARLRGRKAVRITRAARHANPPGAKAHP